LQVGFIGLGVMGQAMATNLVRAGHTLTVFNRTRARTDPLAALGARVAGSPREAAHAADVVIVMVTDDRAVEAVTLGDDGALAGMAPGTLLVDMSTISPRTTRRLAQEAAQRGVTWVDAPVTGGDRGAREGTLTIMVGGPREAFVRLEPLLHVMGQRIVHVGDVGMGQSLKLVGNLISGLTLLAASEGVRLAEAAGVSREAIEAVLPYSSARSYELDKVLEHWRTADWTPGFSVANRTKDLRLAVEMAEQAHFPMALAAVGYQVWAVHADTAGPEDETSILKRWGPVTPMPVSRVREGDA
jgi:3-hydroxyisobutyrate dehydrogenase-like beta-hydroxyacid dehydrogenase